MPRVTTDPSTGEFVHDDERITPGDIAASTRAAPVEAEADDKPQPPENVPEKFWDAEKGEVKTDDLIKSTLALEAKFNGEAEASNTDDDAATAPDSAEAEASDAEADIENLEKQVEEETGQTVEAILETEPAQQAAAEYAELGTVTDETLDELNKLGVSDQMVATWIRGQEALAHQQVQPIYEACGGTQEAYFEALEWASLHYTDEEKAAYDELIVNKDTAVLAAKQLYERYEAERDREPGLMGGTNGVDSGEPPFKNSKELQAAMRNPLYKTSEEYRQIVAKRIAKSPSDLFR